VSDNLYLNQEEFENVFRNNIKSSEYSVSIKTLFGDRMTRKVNYHPYYQRNYVWDKAKASFFIESILLGTDVPPLIFFNAGSRIEVIDGRQRYETIKRFRNGELKLHIKGLTKLPQLKNYTFSKLDPDMQSLLDDAKIRIFEFEVFNEPKLSSTLEDKIKKEIFRRYNSGITPLNSAEIDNATYNDDDITNCLRAIIAKNESLIFQIRETFMNKRGNSDSSKVLQFFRSYLIKSSFPINTFATGSQRSEIADLLYSVKADNTENAEELCAFLIKVLRKTLGLIESMRISESNQLVNNSLLWAVFILMEDDVDISKFESETFLLSLKNFLNDNQHNFGSENSHHYKSIITRHKVVADYFSKEFDFDFSLFIKDEGFKKNVAELRQSEKEAKLKLDELSSLRVQKPDPSQVPIEEIVSELSSNKYLVRPSYQRMEKINVHKASAIIESIILGITLPPLFVYKKIDNVKEVIDGQQRLLSILGFLGKTYQDEHGQLSYAKNNEFQLKGLSILKELNGSRYSNLDQNLQEKILDFRLSIIEISASLNVNFEPVDLFIRLNNKPYPIKENSFEMWNSFMDRDIIKKIRDVTDKNIDWFFISQRKDGGSSDRMLNEELITLLSYIHYNNQYRAEYTSIGYYLRDEKINCRITNKKDVSSSLEKTSVDIISKNRFLQCVNDINDYIGVIKNKLNPDDLKGSLSDLLRVGNPRRYLVDFYMLFEVLQRFDVSKMNDTSLSEMESTMQLIREEMLNPSSSGSSSDTQKYFEGLIESLSN